MTAGEELMIFLEMNGYNISKYKYKKQFLTSRTGNTSLVHKKTLENFLLTYYESENMSTLHTNPLIYLDLWEKQKIDKEKVNIFDFYIKHPRIELETTLQSFIDDATIKEEIKRRILNEIVINWVNEFKEYSRAVISNANEWADEMMKDVEYFRIPTVFKTIAVSVVFILIFISYFSSMPIFDLYHTAIISTKWFNLFFVFLLVFTAFYVIKTDLFRKNVKNVKYTWKKQLSKYESKIDKLMDKFTFRFEDLIENEEFINRRKVIKKLKIIKTINDYTITAKKQILNFEKGFNKVLCKYEIRLHFKEVFFFVILIMFACYLVLGFALSQGWM